MDLNTPADKIARQLGVDVSTPPFAVAALALMNPVTGAMGARVDKAGRMVFADAGRLQTISENFTDYDTNDAVSVIGIGGAARATTTGLVHHMYTPKGNVFCLGNIGVQTTSPVMAETGLDIRGVETNAIGTEIFTHFVGANGRPFVVGRDPGFFMRCSITIADISGATVLLAGFRRAEVNNITYTAYADYAAVGTIASADPGAINLPGEINGAGTSPTDTTDTWANGATKILEIQVSSTGVVRRLINGVAPTVDVALTFDDGDPVIPFIHFIQHTDIAGLITLNSYEVGYL